MQQRDYSDENGDSTHRYMNRAPCEDALDLLDDDTEVPDEIPVPEQDL